MPEIKTISILGCGWFGMKLARELAEEGYTVKGSTTSAGKTELIKSAGVLPFIINFQADTESFDPDFFKTDLLIINIPPKRNSDEVGLYPQKIARIKNAILNAALKNVFFISSTSVYSDGNAEVDETSFPLPETESGKAIFQSENLLKDQSSFELSIIRFAGLIGPGRDPGRFFAGKKNVPNGKAPVNLIHLDDCTGIVKMLIEKGISGKTINACSPDHPSKMDFYVKAALESGLERPDFVPELAKWKIVKSSISDILPHYTFRKGLL